MYDSGLGGCELRSRTRNKHVQPTEEDRVKVEEVAGPQPVSLSVQETSVKTYPPAGARVHARGCAGSAARSTCPAGSPGRRAHRVLGDIPSAGCLGQPEDQFADLSVHRRVTGPVRVALFAGDETPVPGQQRGRRDQPIVAQLPGNSLAEAASTARCGHDSRGRPTWRRKTATSCRNTSSSATTDLLSLRAKTISHRNTPTMIK